MNPIFFCFFSTTFSPIAAPPTMNFPHTFCPYYTILTRHLQSTISQFLILHSKFPKLPPSCRFVFFVVKKNPVYPVNLVKKFLFFQVKFRPARHYIGWLLKEKFRALRRQNDRQEGTQICVILATCRVEAKRRRNARIQNLLLEAGSWLLEAVL
jgi:hypothetical protein